MTHLFHHFTHTLCHYKASSLLNIFGMAVAFAAFYVILTQVQWGFTYNQGLEDGDCLFVMTRPSPDRAGERELIFCRPLAEHILSSVPGVAAYGTLTLASDGDECLYYLKEGDQVRKFRVIRQQGSKGALDAFGFEAEQGSFEEMSRAGSVAVSSRFAAKHRLAVGDGLSGSPTGEPAEFRIVAIWKDKFPENSSPGEADLVQSVGEQHMDDWSEYSYPYVVKLGRAEDKEVFEQGASQVLRELLADQSDDGGDVEALLNKLKVSLVPFDALYYRHDINGKFRVCRSGSRTTDASLRVVAVLIILIALINFVNFFFALVPARIRSVNTYRIFGTPRGTLVLHFILESVGMVVLALMLAAAGVLAFEKLSMADILAAPVDPAANVRIVVLSMAVAVLSAAGSSIYPACYVTSFQPAMVLKGAFGTSSAGRSLRNGLIGVQFVVSLSLVICASFVKLQHDYMMKFDMGFNREQLISGTIPGEVAWWNSKNPAFEDQLRSHPDIVDLTWADGQLVKQARMGWSDTYQGQEMNYEVYPVACNFLDVMGIGIVEGRNFTPEDERSENGVIIFNEEARDTYGITLGARTRNITGDPAEMAGICRNFHFRPLQYGRNAFAFYVFGKDHSWRPQGLTQLYVRIAAGADPAAVMDFIRTTALALSPDMDPDIVDLHCFDAELAGKYRTEDKLGRQVAAFTLIAIILALMGVFGLVLFETQHRMKEMAVKRVLGAEVKDILWMLVRKYAVIVIICFAMAAPVSYLVTKRYFSNFAYPMRIQPWVFAVALVSVLVVTVALVVLRSFRTASRNPVESLKTE